MDKRILFLVILVSTIGVGNMKAKMYVPDDKTCLYLYNNNVSEPILYPSDEFRKITFSERRLELWSNRGVDSYMCEDYICITFRKDIKQITGINNIVDRRSVNLRYDKSSEILLISSPTEVSLVCICDTNGRIVAEKRGAACSFSISLSSVERGVYIVKVTGKNLSETRKIIK